MSAKTTRVPGDEAPYDGLTDARGAARHGRHLVFPSVPVTSLLSYATAFRDGTVPSGPASCPCQEADPICRPSIASLSQGATRKDH
jgi:hypothetical protein